MVMWFVWCMSYLGAGAVGELQCSLIKVEARGGLCTRCGCDALEAHKLLDGHRVVHAASDVTPGNMVHLLR